MITNVLLPFYGSQCTVQQSAIEHLTVTTYRHLKAERVSSLATIVTTDFEALYTYRSKNGDCQLTLFRVVDTERTQL